jgi:hypothetical protein
MANLPSSEALPNLIAEPGAARLRAATHSAVMQCRSCGVTPTASRSRVNDKTLAGRNISCRSCYGKGTGASPVELRETPCVALCVNRSYESPLWIRDIERSSLNRPHSLAASC